MCIALWFYMQVSINNERVIEGRLQIDNVIKGVEAEAAENATAVSYFNQSGVLRDAVGLLNLDGEEKQRVLYRLSGIIDEYAMQTGLEDTVFIYLRRIDTIVTGEGYYSPLAYWRRYYADSGVSFSQWQTIISKSLDVKYNLYSMNFKDKNGAEYQSFLHTTILRRESNLNYSVLAVQSARPIHYSRDMGSAYFVIYDGAGELVYGSGNVKNEMLPVLLRSGTDEILKIGVDRYIINHEMSGQLGFRFVVAVRMYDVFTSSPQPFVYMGVIMIVSLLCIWLLWRISKKNYTVMDRIVSKLKSFRGKGGSANEVTMINHLIDRMLKENQDRERLLLKQRNYFTALNVSRLLSGQVKAFESIQEGLVDEERLKFLSYYFAVVVIVLEDYKSFFDAGTSDVASEEVDLVRFAIKNVSEEVVAASGNLAYFADMENVATLLISFAPEPIESAKQTLAENCRFIQSFLKQQLKIKTTVSISNVCMGLSDIQTVYKQALEIAEYKYMLGEELIITPDDIEIQKEVRYGYTQEREGLLVNMIKLGDAERATALISDVLEPEGGQRLIDLKQAQLMSYDIAATLLRFCGEADIDEADFSENAFLEALTDAKNVEGVKTVITDAARRLCDRHQDAAAHSLAKRVSAYIEEAFADHSLSVSRIAERFHLHPTYMSNMFREKMGIGMLEYINKVRVSKSSELLVTTGLNINEISERVGYISTNTYIRIFKKITGVTPGQYRIMEVGK
jgi:AraC-like DNA-binding protein